MKTFTYQELREIVKARRFLKKYGFSVDLMCDCEDRGDCLSCQMSSIKAARRAAMEKELAAKEKQRQLDTAERYLMTHGYEITRPDGNHIPLDIDMVGHRVRCGTIDTQFALDFLKKCGKSMGESDRLMAYWMWPNRYERKS